MYQVSPKFRDTKVYLINKDGSRRIFPNYENFISHKDITGRFLMSECGVKFSDRVFDSWRDPYKRVPKFEFCWKPSYVIRYEDGRIIYPNKVVEDRYNHPRNERWFKYNYYSNSFRKGPVPSRGHHRHCCGRRMKIVQEKRKGFDNKFEINYNLSTYIEINFRGCRKMKSLPDDWEIPPTRRPKRNWKLYRNHQWRDK